MNLLDALKDTNVGSAFLLNQANEPALVMKLPEDVDFGAHTPIGYGVWEWYQYEPEGVIIRSLVQVYQDLQHLQHPLIFFDTFINPNDEEGRRLLQHMATASFLWCLAWWNDADLTFLGRKQLRWQDQHRQNIIQLIEASKGTTTQWPAAKIRCMREHPIL
jgi:hypothetical protein